MRLDIMTFEQMNEEQRKFMTYDQAALEEKKKMKSEASGLFILGIPLLILGIANQTVLGLMYDKDSSMTQLLITIGAVLLGVICCIFGIRFLGKKGDSIAEGVRRLNDNFYTVEDIYDYYREIREGNDIVIFLSNKKHIKEEDQGDVGLFTKNWMKIPRQRPIAIAKLSDIVAVWHDKEGYTEFGYKGLYILRSDGRLYGMDCHENFSGKVMEEIGKRNPLTIQARRFTYEGNTYDVCSNKEQVIQIYKQNMARQLNTNIR